MIRLPASLERSLAEHFPRIRDREHFAAKVLEDALKQNKAHDLDMPEAVGGTLHLFTDGGSRGNPEEAASRRDFTINAISYDPLTKEIIDPYNGREDLKNKILRHTSDSFSDDPLRLLRAMQFGARFGFDLAPETAELARSI
jgi:tRNA nucleotidyltransferase (CCA-adding enzyme)